MAKYNENKSFGRIRNVLFVGGATQWFTLLGNFKKYKGRCNYFKTYSNTTTYQSKINGCS